MSPAEFLLRPSGLPLVLLGPAAWVLFVALDRFFARRLKRAVGPRVDRLSAELGTARRRLRRVLWAAALLLALFAVLEPVGKEIALAAGPRGADLVVCLDVSRSMLARDVPPDRLSRARQEIQSLTARAEGDRMALVLFAGEARLAVPLTRDMASCREMLGEAGVLSVRRGGTDLGAALTAALAALEGGSGGHGAILLLTDGEDIAGRGLAVAPQCRDRGVAVHCVGFGSALGAKIPVESAAGEAFLRDREGREVVSAMDSADLEKIAAATGGSFVSATERPGALVDLYARRLKSLAGEPRAGEMRRVRENRFQWPLGAAMLLWTLELCIGDRRRRR